MPHNPDVCKKTLYLNPVTGITPYRVTCKSHSYFGNHWHSEIEIFYLLPQSGPIMVYIEECPYTLSARDMLVVPSAAVHRIEADENTNRLLRINVGYPLLGENFRPFTEKRFQNPHYSFSVGSSPEINEIEPIFTAISKEKLALDNDNATADDFEMVISRMRISAYLFQITAHLLETMPIENQSSSINAKKHTYTIMQNILFFIRDHYNDPITLGKVADMAGYEKTYFCQIFKNITGETFHQYLTKRRLEASLPLLRDTTLPIGSIAQAVGIPQLKTFSRLFRIQYGLSPLEMRNGSENNTTGEI